SARGTSGVAPAHAKRPARNVGLRRGVAPPQRARTQPAEIFLGDEFAGRRPVEKLSRAVLLRGVEFHAGNLRDKIAEHALIVDVRRLVRMPPDDLAGARIHETDAVSLL